MSSTMKRRSYKYGDKVEVCSKEEGFVGSYFEATIVSCLLQWTIFETVHPYELRPLPPRVRSPREFQLNQKVDAFDNDGWWLGQITSEKIITEEGHYYKVYFDTTYETICYPCDRIRVHHNHDY
ncbi:agenet domain protein [Medicago truncatula]|uniref:Agenet domain protein n=1 Tax=Medicago truncatula TaxID=3880 RepID=G7I3M8_MEDTR|nr:agenet domain protein [Medicago truncatula]